MHGIRLWMYKRSFRVIRSSVVSFCREEVCLCMCVFGYWFAYVFRAIQNVEEEVSHGVDGEMYKKRRNEVWIVY